MGITFDRSVIRAELERQIPTEDIGAGIDYFRGVRITLRCIQGIADIRDPDFAADLGLLLAGLPGSGE